MGHCKTGGILSSHDRLSSWHICYCECLSEYFLKDLFLENASLAGLAAAIAANLVLCGYVIVAFLEE